MIVGLRSSCLMIGITMFSLIPFLMFGGGLIDEAAGHYELTDEQREKNYMGLMIWFMIAPTIIICSLIFDNVHRSDWDKDTFMNPPFSTSMWVNKDTEDKFYFEL